MLYVSYLRRFMYTDKKRKERIKNLIDNVIKKKDRTSEIKKKKVRCTVNCMYKYHCGS